MKGWYVPWILGLSVFQFFFSFSGLRPDEVLNRSMCLCSSATVKFLVQTTWLLPFTTCTICLWWQWCYSAFNQQLTIFCNKSWMATRSFSYINCNARIVLGKVYNMIINKFSKGTWKNLEKNKLWLLIVICYLIPLLLPTDLQYWIVSLFSWYIYCATPLLNAVSCAITSESNLTRIQVKRVHNLIALFTWWPGVWTPRIHPI